MRAHAARAACAAQRGRAAQPLARWSGPPATHSPQDPQPRARILYDGGAASASSPSRALLWGITHVRTMVTQHAQHSWPGCSTRADGTIPANRRLWCTARGRAHRPSSDLPIALIASHGLGGGGARPAAAAAADRRPLGHVGAQDPGANRGGDGLLRGAPPRGHQGEAPPLSQPTSRPPHSKCIDNNHAQLTTCVEAACRMGFDARRAACGSLAAPCMARPGLRPSAQSLRPLSTPAFS